MIQEPYTQYEINARNLLAEFEIPYIPSTKNENDGGK